MKTKYMPTTRNVNPKKVTDVLKISDNYVYNIYLLYYERSFQMKQKLAIKWHMEMTNVHVNRFQTADDVLYVDRLIFIVVSTWHPIRPWFDSRLLPRNFPGSIGSGTGSTQPREDNWIATWITSSVNRLRKPKLGLRVNALLTTRPTALQSGSNRFSRSRFFGAVTPWIMHVIATTRDFMHYNVQLRHS